MSAPIRFLGLDLGGARSARTSLAILESYPKERKIFLLDVQDRVIPQTVEPADHHIDFDSVLLERITASIQNPNDFRGILAINAPLDLPPCIFCTRKYCPMPAKCTVSEVVFMRQQNPPALIPYLHRPAEVWAKKHLSPELPKDFRVDIEEALGSNRAPLASRFHFLRRHIPEVIFAEVWPKISIARLAISGVIPRKWATQFRTLEEGSEARAQILETIIKRFDLFIYERDQKNLADHLSAFDAFICAFTAYLSEIGLTEKKPKNYPKKASWILIPKHITSRESK